MRNERRETDIEVSVIDLTNPLGLAHDQWKDEHPDSDATAMKPHGSGAWSFVETPKGRFYLCTEGVGWLVKTGDDLTLEISTETITDEGTSSFSIFPQAELGVSWEMQLDLPVTEKINLAEFIRRFGHRLECNYQEIREYLTSNRKFEIVPNG